MKKILLALIVIIAEGVFFSLCAQSFTITGSVVDMNGETMPGVNIVEQGAANNGAISDVNGNFKITVDSSKSVLIFSFIGYENQKITVGRQRNLNVTMLESGVNLEEVVVVGYGSQKKASVVGAISTADAKELQSTGTTNLTQAIGGRIAGVISRSPGGRPGEDDASVYIRGIASYNSGTSSPLVLVDGIERDYSQIDPEDIETFSVLKDASATAVFGVRGANGVILITTKRGETSKPVVDLRASFTMNTPINLPEKLGSYDFARLKNEALMNVGEVPEYSAYDLEMYRTGASPYTHPDNDYISDLLKDVTTKQQYNLTVRGGTPFVRYYVSANYVHEKGIYETFDNNDYDSNVYFKRYGMRTNLDFNVTKTTIFGVDLSGRLEERHDNDAGTDLYQSMVRLPPNFLNYVNPDGSYGGKLNAVNPYAALSKYGYNHSKRNVFEAVVKLNQKLDFITKGLSARAMFGFVSNMASRRDITERPELWEYSTDGQYTIVNEETPLRVDTSAGPHRRNITTEFAVNYDRKFGSHAITGLLAFNQLAQYRDEQLPTGYINYVGRITYGYKSKYLAEFNAGYNGSVQFAEGKRYGFFPAFSLGWVVSEEGFWNKKSKIFNYMKIRGAYGEVGNDKIGSDKYYYLQTYPMLTSNRPSFGLTNNPENRIYEGKEGNVDVTWERARKLNLGVDMRFFESKLALTVDVFTEKRINIIDYDRSISTIYGMLGATDSSKGFPPQNLGEVRNSGFELDASFNDRIGKLSYYVKGNVSFARNKILQKGEEPQTYPWTSAIGRKVNQRFGMIVDGFYNTQEEIDALPSRFSSNLKLGDLKYRDINGDGVIDSYDVTAIGKTRLPEIMYGFTLGGEWKGIDCQIFFQGAAITDLYVNGYGYWEFTNTGSVMKHHLGRWTPENKDHATYPSLSPTTSKQNHRLSTFWLKNGNYLRLKNVQIGYTLPSNWMKKAKITSARIYVSGTNLLTFAGFKEYDPESSDGGNTSYPQMRNYSVGLNLKF